MPGPYSCSNCGTLFAPGTIGERPPAASSVKCSVCGGLVAESFPQPQNPTSRSLAMQGDDASERTLVRPQIAAYAFGSVVVVILAFAGLFLIEFVRSFDPILILAALSVAAPSAPLVYFAARGFRSKRRSAFEALPQRACGYAALGFLISGFLLALVAGNWGLAIGPSIAAFLFALCVESLRESMSILP
jgi:hypothetical protein